MSGNQTPQPFTYDLAGNLKTDGVATYKYDAANRLTSATKGTNQYHYGHDGLGHRYSQTVNGVQTKFELS